MNASTPTIRHEAMRTEEKQQCLSRLAAFHEHYSHKAPPALEKLRRVALENGNVFAELLDCVQYCSLGQVTNALFEVGGEYRRNL